MDLPIGFKEMIGRLLGDDAPRLLEALQSEPVTSVRINTRKPGAIFPGSKPVPWCPTGFYLPSRPVFTLDPLLHAGAYYVQDASSMIYREVIRRIATSPATLLDMCAAPGGKTTAMIDALPDGSRVVANEYVARRAAILKENLAKWGYPLAVVTNRDSAFFANSADRFDIVAVDAPCSGEGMMRKDEDAVRQWSPQLVSDCAALQKTILSNAAEVVKPGGYLIYSTCTFNREENEEVAEFIRSSLRLEPVDLNFPAEWGIPRGIDTDLPVYRFMPHVTEGEGLFLAVFRRPGSEAFSNPLPSSIPERRKVERKSPKPAKGAKQSAPSRKGMREPQEEIPEIEEILSLDFDRSRFPEAEIDLPTALSYLRRESITLSPDLPKGYVVVTYKGLPLGLAKNIGSRANNLYPKGWRILMQ